MARRNRTPSSALTEAGELDVAVCESARVNRDRRYDGLFFSGVRTTRVYCRPVCPVRPAKAKNVTFYPSAAAAENDGFRPCLRCRPETAPFSPAWKGSQTTVERASSVQIEPVSGRNLRKTGISADGPETFDYFASEIERSRIWRQSRVCENQGFPGL